MQTHISKKTEAVPVQHKMKTVSSLEPTRRIEPLTEEPLQRAIKLVGEEDKELSFMQAHDLQGNPHLVTKGSDPKEYWKFKGELTDEAIEQVPDVTIDWSEENKDTIFHNLSRGRQQHVEDGDQVNIYHPFKSWIFGYDKRPDVAVYNRNKQEAGRSYPSLLKEMEETIAEGASEKGKELRSPKDTATLLGNVGQELEGIVRGEEYRTPGSLAHWKPNWENALEASSDKPMNKRKRKRLSKLKKNDRDVLKLATTQAGFAGKGGKEAFRTNEEIRRTRAFQERLDKEASASKKRPAKKNKKEEPSVQEEPYVWFKESEYPLDDGSGSPRRTPDGGGIDPGAGWMEWNGMGS